MRGIGRSGSSCVTDVCVLGSRLQCLSRWTMCLCSARVVCNRCWRHLDNPGEKILRFAIQTRSLWRVHAKAKGNFPWSGWGRSRCRLRTTTRRSKRRWMTCFTFPRSQVKSILYKCPPCRLTVTSAITNYSNSKSGSTQPVHVIGTLEARAPAIRTSDIIPFSLRKLAP